MFHRPSCTLEIVPVELHLDAEILSRDLESSLFAVCCGVDIEILGPSGCSESPQLMEELRSDGSMSISGVTSPMLESSLSEPALTLR